MLRERQSDLTLAEVQAWTTAVALSGGMVLLSDDLPLLEGEPERDALLARALPPSGQAATALSPYVDGMASRAQLAVEREWERWLVAAVFNWGDSPEGAAFDPAEWAMPGDTYHLYDLWSEEHRGPLQGATDLGPTPPHGARLLAVHADKGRPQLVGSTLHLLGGVVELSEETWAGDALTLHLDCPGEREGTLAVYVPQGFRFHEIEAASALKFDIREEISLLVVGLRFADKATVALSFDREEAPA
jgi:hypothetical protein